MATIYLWRHIHCRHKYQPSLLSTVLIIHVDVQLIYTVLPLRRRLNHILIISDTIQCEKRGHKMAYFDLAYMFTVKNSQNLCTYGDMHKNHIFWVLNGVYVDNVQ